MKFEQINRRFTEKVSELISEGYIIHTSTMGGSQGEIAKVDLTDGKDVVRVLLYTGCYGECVDDRYYIFNFVRLTVGRSTDNVKVNGSTGNDIVWSSKLDMISHEEFYEIGRRGSCWYGTKEESMAQQDKARDRYDVLHGEGPDLTSPEAVRIVLPFVCRQHGCKSVTAREIQRVGKNMIMLYDGPDDKPRMRYWAQARGHKFYLK